MSFDPSNFLKIWPSDSKSSGKSIALAISRIITSTQATVEKTMAPASSHPLETVNPAIAVNASESNPIQKRQAAKTSIRTFEGRIELFNLD